MMRTDCMKTILVLLILTTLPLTATGATMMSLDSSSDLGMVTLTSEDPPGSIGLDEEGGDPARPGPGCASLVVVPPNDPVCLHGPQREGYKDGASGDPIVQPGASAMSITTQYAPLEVIRPGTFHLEPFIHEDRDALVRVGQHGNVAVMTLEGETIWERQPVALRPEWGFPPLSSTAFSPTVLMSGTGAWGTGDPVAVHDITENGAADVVVAYNLVREDLFTYRAVVAAFDGTDGDLLWHHVSAGRVTGVTFSGDTLVIAETYGSPGTAEGIASLSGFRFGSTGDGFGAEMLWSLTPEGGERARWAGPVDLGDGRLAVAHTPREWSETTLMVLDAEAGTIDWSQQGLGPIAHIVLDEIRNELVFTEALMDLDDTLGPVITVVSDVVGDEGPVTVDDEGWFPGADGFTVRAASVDEGTFRIGSVPRLSGVPQQLALGDLVGDGSLDWVVTTDLRPTLYEEATGHGWRSTIVAYSGATGIPLWERTVGSYGLPDGLDLAESFLPPSMIHVTSAHGLGVTNGVVYAASGHPHIWVDNWELRAFDGLTGSPQWSRTGDSAISPSSLRLFERDGEVVLLGINEHGTYRMYDPGDGSERSRVGLLSEVHAVVGIDVDENGLNDIIVGSKSGGIFALDPRSFTLEGPTTLWHTTLDGPIIELHLVDLDGDGSDALIAVAAHEVAVLHPQTGAVDYRIPYPDRFAWTIAFADVTGDGNPDLLVPTTSIDAYNGLDGALIWSYQGNAPLGTEAFFSTLTATDQMVVAQSVIQATAAERPMRDAMEINGGIYVNMLILESRLVGLDLASGTERWLETMTATEGRASLYGGTTPAAEWTGVDGEAVAVLFYEGFVEAGAAFRLRVLDARTGDDLEVPQVDYGAMWLAHLTTTADGRLLVHPHVGTGTWYVGPDKALRSPGYTMEAMASGWFGEILGERLVYTFGSPRLMATDAFETGAAPAWTNPGPFGRIERGITVDVTGDGIDAVVGFSPDHDTLDTMLGKVGIFTKAWSTTSRGIWVAHITVE